jgi:SPP1 family predicted phage head-tail adaptor
MIEGIDPGHLDRRIILQKRTTAANEYNEPIETWTTLDTVWSMVEYPMTGSDEQTTAGLIQATTRVEFTIRYRTDIGFINRIQYNSTIFDIERISEVGRNSFLKITAERRK